MSTEQKDLETNALASRLTGTWDRFKKGQLVSYRVMAVVLLVAAGGFVWWYIAHERSREKVRAWIDLGSADSIAGLEKFREGHKNELVGRLAALNEARVLLGPDGIDQLAPLDVDLSALSRPGAKLEMADIEAMVKAAQSRQPAAVANVEKARGLFEELAPQFNDQPVLKTECYMGCAKAEAVLLGVPKEGQPTETRGNAAKLRECLEKVAETAPDTPWGTRAKDMAEKLARTDFQTDLKRIQTELLARDTRGGFGPMSVPGAVSPHPSPVSPVTTPAPSPGTTPTPVPPVPGVPSPKAPTGTAPPTQNTPAVTPGPVTTPPPPVGTTPIPPSVSPVTPGQTPSTPAPPPPPPMAPKK
jgi:hypothetical protein